MEEDKAFVRYDLTRIKYCDIFAVKQTRAGDFVRIFSKYQAEITMEDGEAALFLDHIDGDTNIYEREHQTGAKLAHPPGEAEGGVRKSSS